MWKLTSITIKNIISFREATLEIQQGVATLIFGKNEDNASQPHNGSGKSSLVEAISFALTGEQLRKVKTVEEIINDSSDSAYVKLRLDNSYDSTSFVIERTITRGQAQMIECHKYDSNGVEIQKDKTIQPSVLDYNRFILSEIGLSKDDIYNYFILCDNKFQSFFDSPDKDKKEIINRFSNGLLVDESIEKVQADLEPIEEEWNKRNEEVIKINGSINAIENELRNIDVKNAAAQNEREASLKKFEELIIQTREKIETTKSNIVRAENRLEVLSEIQGKIADIRDSDTSLLNSYNVLKGLCQEYNIGVIADYDKLSNDYKDDCADYQDRIDAISKKIELTSEQLKSSQAEYQNRLDQYNGNKDLCKETDEKDVEQKKKIQFEAHLINQALDVIEGKFNTNKQKRAEIEELIIRNKTILGGAIECPKCGFKFISGGEKSVDEINQEIDALAKEKESRDLESTKLQDEYDKANSDYDSKITLLEEIDRNINNRNNALDKERTELRVFLKKVDDIDNSLSEQNKTLRRYQSELEKIQGSLEVLRNKMFGEVEGLIDNKLSSGNDYISQLKSSLAFSEGQLSQYCKSKRELEESSNIDLSASLKESLEQYNQDLSKAKKKCTEVECEKNGLKGQIVNFTMFKSYLARKKIDALAVIVNDFLAKIGSDIQLRLEGFTTTRTGKLRDRISVQVIRDGVDCGSYYKFSGGERARLNLACILSLHTLINSNCDDGKGLDFLIIDEVLDKSDEVGMATYCEALNRLNQTALLITQGNVAEGYPHKLLIVKKQGISTILK